jgi:hypothetical protein
LVRPDLVDERLKIAVEADSLYNNLVADGFGAHAPRVWMSCTCGGGNGSAWWIGLAIALAT